MKIEFTLIDDSGNNYQGFAELKAPSLGATGASRAPAVAQSEQQGLPVRILILRDSGFFREPRTPSEVHAKLLETYSCLLNRVQMAVLRLHRRRELRKTIKKVGDHENTAYVW
jgi:hypothetical protein